MMKLTKKRWQKILKSKKIFIFDLDGTIIDSVFIWDQADQEVISFFTNKIIPLDTIHEDREMILTTTTDKEIYYAYCGFLKDKYHISASKEEISKMRYETTRKYIREQVKFKDKAEELLSLLKSEGYLLALATTTNRGSIDLYNNENINTKHFNFDAVFDLILTKDNVMKNKPNPEIHYKIMDYFHVKAPDCIIFEDTRQGIEAGHNANIEVIGIANGNDMIKSLADYYIDSFHDII